MFPSNYLAYLHTPSDDAYSDVVDASAVTIQSTAALGDPYYNYLYTGPVDPRLVGNLGGPWGGTSASVGTLTDHAAFSSMSSAASLHSASVPVASAVPSVSAASLPSASATVAVPSVSVASHSSAQPPVAIHEIATGSSSVHADQPSFGSASSDVPLRHIFRKPVWNGTYVEPGNVPLLLEWPAERSEEAELVDRHIDEWPELPADALPSLAAGDGQMASVVARERTRPPVQPSPLSFHPGSAPKPSKAPHLGNNKMKQHTKVRRVETPAEKDTRNVTYERNQAARIAMDAEADANALERRLELQANSIKPQYATYPPIPRVVNPAENIERYQEKVARLQAKPRDRTTEKGKEKKKAQRRPLPPVEVDKAKHDAEMVYALDLTREQVEAMEALELQERQLRRDTEARKTTDERLADAMKPRASPAKKGREEKEAQRKAQAEERKRATEEKQAQRKIDAEARAAAARKESERARAARSQKKKR